MPEPEEPMLGVAAVARRLGVATGTLRTWDRRYGLGPSEHVAGSRRRYSGADLARLETMRRLLLDGVTPAEAARVALVETTTGATGDSGAAGAMWVTAGPLPPAAPRRARAGGGRIVALPEATPAVRGLARAAMSLDADTCTATLVAALRRRGVVPTWNELLHPVLTGVGERWRATGEGAEVESLLGECAETALRTGVRARPAASRRPILLAALEPEDHRLALVAVAAALAERGLPARLLGTRLPVRALADAVTRLGPAAVLLWSQGSRGPGVVPSAEVLRAVRPRPVLLLGGPGYDTAHQPAARCVASLEESVTAVESVLGVGGPAGTPQRPPRSR